MDLIKLILRDDKNKIIESCVLMPEEAADKAREFVYLQGSDPHGNGIGAVKGKVSFEPVTQDNPKQEKSKFLKGYHGNYDTLLRAVKNGDLALMECRWKKTEAPVAVACAVERFAGGANFVPLAVLFAANPYELVIPMGRDLTSEPITNEEKLVAELHELEARAASIRMKLDLPQCITPVPQSTEEKKFMLHPMQCPVCDSKDIGAEGFDGEGRDVTSNCQCYACHASWKELYSLYGFINLERGDTNANDNPESGSTS